MRAGARLAAAMDVIAAMEREHRPASVALADWGRAHRFAGSGDRAAIGTLVFDVLRRRKSYAAQMGSDTPRALVLAAASRAFAMSVEEIAAATAAGEAHAPHPLSDDERLGLGSELGGDVAVDVRADVPEWLVPSMERAFGDRLVDEGEALAARAPIDLRVNTLKADRDKVLKALSRFSAEPTPFSPVGVRIAAPSGAARAPNVEADAAHGKGWFEVQDEGSQIAAALAGARVRQQVLDLCAGAGGKTLALAAAMGNTGQIYAYDSARQQLRPMFERLKRAGVRNVQVMDGGDRDALEALGSRFDVVFVDAPCTGSGTWRRRPDSKWRLKAEALAQRLSDQDAVLADGARMVKPGGRLVYVTCSILPEENIDRVSAFLAARGDFALVPISEVWAATLGGAALASADGRADTLQLTPAMHGTDGFFIAVMRRADGQ